MFEIKKYSKTGDAHIHSNKECQDVTFVQENDRFKVALLADGVSACENGAQGAKIACEAVADLLFQLGELIYSFSSTKLCFLLLEEVKCCLKNKADNTDILDSYSSTLSFCCIDKQEGKAIVFNLGDSAVIITTKNGDDLRIEGGAASGDTFTTTEDAYKKASLNIYDMADVDLHRVFLCSDGVLRNILIDSFVSETFRRGLALGDYSSIDTLIESGAKHDDRSYISVDMDEMER